MSGNTRCPQCNRRLILQAFWQGRHVNCTSCGARLQRGIAGIALSAAVGIVVWIVAEWLMQGTGIPMEVEIPAGLLALFVGYTVVHILTLKLVPREDETRLNLD